MDISIIIVNYNVKYFLEQCLYSVTKACANLTTQIFVVDNNSSDGSKAYLEHKFPTVIFKWRQTNDGFAKANNSVLTETTGDHILFLNPDTIVPEDCFEKCIHFFQTHAGAGALGVKMIDGAGLFLKESKRSFPSPLTSFFKMTGMAWLFPRSALFAKYYAGHLPEQQSNEVDVLAGAFMMLTKKALQLVHVFDEDYFMYGEDIDLSYCLQEAGFKNYYFPGTSIIHFKGESTQRSSRTYTRNFYDAMQMFVTKHYKQQRLAFFFMKLTISFSRFVASGKLFFRQMTQTKNRAIKPTHLAVLGGQQTFEAMIRLLKYAQSPVVIEGRIAVDHTSIGFSIGSFDSIESIIHNRKLDQLIFCEPELSFKAIIENTARLKKQAGFLFHAGGSQSIVGSNNSNAQGIFIAEESPSIVATPPASR